MSLQTVEIEKVEQVRAQESMSLSKLMWEGRKIRLEVYLLALALAYALAFSFGAGLIFFYFLRNDFNPGGISASDTVLMSLTSFGFLIFVSVLLYIAAFIGYPISRSVCWILTQWREYRIRRCPVPDGGGINTVALSQLIGTPVQPEWGAGARSSLILGSLGLAGMAGLLYIGPPNLYRLVIPMLGAGAFLSLFLFGKSRQVYSRWPKIKSEHGVDLWMDSLSSGWRNFVICIFVVGGIMLVGFQEVEDISLMAVGFRKQNVSVRLAKDDFNQLVNKATRAGMAINPCEVLEDDAYVVNRVDVLWHKLGNQGLLRFPTQGIWEVRPAARSSFTIEPLNTNLSPLRTTGPVLQCEEFLSDFLFKPGSGDFLPSGVAKLDLDLNWLSDGRRDKIVKVVVHGTETPVANGLRQKDGLNYKQAAAIRNYLIASYHLEPSTVLLVNEWNVVPKRRCSVQEGPAQKLCERMNRRIEVSRYSATDFILPE